MSIKFEIKGVSVTADTVEEAKGLILQLTDKRHFNVPVAAIAKNSKAKKVYSNEISREANKYAKLNIELNKVKDKVELVPGDVKRVVERWKKGVQLPSSAFKEVASLHRKGRLREGNRRCPRFDVIVMARPQLKESFLKQAFALSKKGTRIFYYDFCKVGEEKSVIEKIKREAKKAKKKIKILKIKKAGEIAPYKIRVRVDFIIN